MGEGLKPLAVPELAEAKRIWLQSHTDQRFHRGDVVRLAQTFPVFMEHFHGAGECAIVLGSYLDKCGTFGGRERDRREYSLLLPSGLVESWYDEDLLTLLPRETKLLAERTREIIDATRKEPAVGENRLHKLCCDEAHAHHAPECCDLGCWCRREAGVAEKLKSLTAEKEPAVPLKPKIVTLCGSSRFVDVMAVCGWLLEREEKAITMGLHLLPRWYTNAEHHLAEAEGVAAAMDALHLKKIDLSDEIFVVNVGDYIGASTRREVEYAIGAGKHVRWFTHDEIGEKVRAIQEGVARG